MEKRTKRNFSKLAEEMFDGSYFTIEGCDLTESTLDEWVAAVNKVLVSHELPTVPTEEWVVFKGAEMNREYGLTGTNRYVDNLTFLAFPLTRFEGDDVYKIAMVKLLMGARWFDDIVCNNARREEMKYDEEVRTS